MRKGIRFFQLPQESLRNAAQASGHDLGRWSCSNGCAISCLSARTPIFQPIGEEAPHVQSVPQSRPLALLQMTRVIGAERFTRHLDPELFERAFHPRQYLEMAEESPESALIWLQAMLDIAGEPVLRHLAPEFFERALNLDYIVDLADQNTEAAMSWIQAMTKPAAGQFKRRHFDPDVWESSFDDYSLRRAWRQTPAVLGVLLRPARILGLTRVAHRLAKFLTLGSPASGRPRAPAAKRRRRSHLAKQDKQSSKSKTRRAVRDTDRDRGKPRGSSPPTPPYMRVRMRRFRDLSR